MNYTWSVIYYCYYSWFCYYAC